jgi:hypothetical protein
VEERSTVAAFLRELGHRIGTSLALDEDGSCAMTYGGDQEITVIVPEGSGSVVFHGPVATCPAASREAFFERALKLNLLGIENGGCLLGLEGDGRRIVLALCQPVGTLDARGFENLLANFIDIAQRTRASLAEPLDEPAPSERRAAAEYSEIWQNLSLRA